jgi:predicted nucleic acid-binding protein
VRTVLDTSVVMPALLWRGKPYQLLEAIRQRDDSRGWRGADRVR